MKGRLGGLLTALGFVAVAIAGYLSLVKITGGAPACAVVSGCETVNSSEYSTIAGVPVALLGLGVSLAILGGALLWWRAADRRGLYLAYAMGLVSLPVLAWLTWLELAVIHAVCAWCVAYAVAVVTGWVGAALVLRSDR